MNYQYGDDMNRRTDTRVYNIIKKTGTKLQCYNLKAFFDEDTHLMSKKMQWDEADVNIRYLKFRKFPGAKDSIYMDEFWITSSPPICK